MADIDSAALRLSASFVNQFQIVVTGTNVRIAFAEGFSGQGTNYRSAVMMSEADARELALSILTSLPDRRGDYTNALTGMMTNQSRGLFGGLGSASPGLIPPNASEAIADAIRARANKKD